MHLIIPYPKPYLQSIIQGKCLGDNEAGNVMPNSSISWSIKDILIKKYDQKKFDIDRKLQMEVV